MPSCWVRSAGRSGPVPRPPLRPEQGLLRLRRELGAFANLRPWRCTRRWRMPRRSSARSCEGVDLVFVRELTGGIYFGEKRRDARSASDLCTYTVEEIERIVRVAAQLARTRRRKLTSIDKSNVLETSRLWREVAQRVVSEEFKDVTLEHMLVDSAAMHLIRRPRDFDVLVTENMFGDILTDEAAMLAGSLGLLPSASLGDGRHGIYEPIHGSAPDIAGRGIANPYGAILSAAMLLRHSLKLEAEAAALEACVYQAFAGGRAHRGHGPRRRCGGEHRRRPGPPCSATCSGADRGRRGVQRAHPLQCAREVLAQVRQSLDPDRQAQQAVGQSRARARCRIHRRVRHGGRMRHQALDAAQGFGEREALEASDELAHRLVTAGELERDHRPEALLLALGQLMPRVRGQARVPHASAPARTRTATRRAPGHCGRGAPGARAACGCRAG